MFARRLGYATSAELDADLARHTTAVAELFAESAIKDDVLRMMFSCCQPKLPEQAQVMLILHTLCGFGVGEIAGAFLSSPAAIEKRLTRAKKMLGGEAAALVMSMSRNPRITAMG